MKKDDSIVIINGKKYDKATGAFISVVDKSSSPAKKSTAQSFHNLTQKSKTLYRNAVKKPTAVKSVVTKHIGQSMDISRSPIINRFHKPDVQLTEKEKATKKEARQLAVHPLVAKSSTIIKQAKQAGQNQSGIKTSKEMLNEARKKALAQSMAQEMNGQKKKKPLKRILIAIALIMSVGAAFFATYYLIPSIGVYFASIESGVEAKYPKFVPDGYRLKRPIRKTEGHVMLDFVANTGDTFFTLSQRKSTWDSAAVKDDIEGDSDNNLKTINERGLTIFIYKYNAAWVNGGIYYQLRGNAPLSSEQILRIVVSL